MTTKFTTPKINLNGTSAETLYEEFSEARVNLTRALKGLRVLTVHPRDFQTIADGDWIQAKTEYYEAMNRVDDALDWVDAWLVAIEEHMST
jgi:hypothetical protein